jgi:glycosyltransferase involved in cell wall biosynthesis
MKVSVIINCHNGSDYIQKALNSVISQTHKEFEIIFFDNASTDQTFEIVTSYDDYRLKYFRSDRYLTLGQARNEAIELSSGDIIAFLDADDVWKAQKLELQIKCFTKDVGIVYTGADIIHNEKITKSVSNNSIEGFVFGELLADYFLVMSSVAVSRAALESLSHFFDPRFEIIEEYDLFLRISVNWKVRCIPQQLTQWRWHEASTTMEKTHLISKEKKIFLRKLKTEYPTLCQTNAGAIKKVKGKILITMALVLFRNGRSQKARYLLRKSHNVTAKGFFVYFFTFFPHYLVDKLYRVIKGNPLI